MQLAGISYPLVNKNHAGAVLIKEFTQQVTGAGSHLVISSHPVKSLFPTELPRKFTP